ncbi:hypothetical protein BG60_13700 [Caballeronia zhejiangensis]|uniref:Uncharacterized protein n=1 Tax=Caballeronia zhejiangensis TaxID=871203 RepID=A0A656QV47_9BURK|nr:hypothetical protein BG60_13700 [Caballeronia zhejiangensis]
MRWRGLRRCRVEKWGAENDEIARNCLFRLTILRDDAGIRALSCLIARFCAAFGAQECGIAS